MSDKAKLVKRLEKFLPTALADQIAEEVVDSLWLAEHDEEVRAGVVAEEPEWEYGIHSDITGNVNSVGAPWMDREFAEKVTANHSGNYGVRRRKAGPWVPVKQEGATDV